jgi:hypothetical protein
MINPKYASQIQRNLDGFKEAVRKLCDRNSLNDGQRDKYYLFAKAELYNIDITDFIDDLVGLEQAIDVVEMSERRIQSSDREDYYNKISRGC